MALFEQTEPFESGQFVKTKRDVFGTVMPYDPSLHPTEPTVNPGKDGPSPFEMNNKVRIPKNSIGEVLSSDAFHTAVIFPINSTGRLQPQLIKAEGATSDFGRVVRGPIHPFLDAGGRRKDKAVDLTPEESAAFGDKIISKWKKGMATQTGEPEIDSLIERFMVENNKFEHPFNVEEDEDGEEYPAFYNLHDFTGKDIAEGSCSMMANEFALFLKQNGIEAYSSEANNDWGVSNPLDVYPAHPPEVFGYNDQEQGGRSNFEFHAVTIIPNFKGQTYMVDWTASQYNYDEFPMVQRLNSIPPNPVGDQDSKGEDYSKYNFPKWDRKWTKVTESKWHEYK